MFHHSGGSGDFHDMCDLCSSMLVYINQGRKGGLFVCGCYDDCDKIIDMQ